MKVATYNVLFLVIAVLFKYLLLSLFLIKYFNSLYYVDDYYALERLSSSRSDNFYIHFERFSRHYKEMTASIPRLGHALVTHLISIIMQGRLNE